MRKMVEPPPASKCSHCNGQLKLKRVDAANMALEVDTSIYVCANCGREFSFSAPRNHYEAQSTDGPRAMRR